MKGPDYHESAGLWLLGGLLEPGEYIRKGDMLATTEGWRGRRAWELMVGTGSRWVRPELP